jgi:hypothetical protein
MSKAQEDEKWSEMIEALEHISSEFPYFVYIYIHPSTTNRLPLPMLHTNSSPPVDNIPIPIPLVASFSI